MLARDTSFRPASELRSIAQQFVWDKLPTETAQTVPVPVPHGRDLAAVILYYEQPFTPKAPPYPVFPPHHRLLLHASTGELLRYEAITPQKLRLRYEPDVAIPDPGIAEAFLTEDAWKYPGRVLEISHLVWHAYTVKGTSLSVETEALVREYIDLFRRMHKPTVLTFYQAVAPDYFAWLARYGFES